MGHIYANPLYNPKYHKNKHIIIIKRYHNIKHIILHHQQIIILLIIIYQHHTPYTYTTHAHQQPKQTY
jgi:hypothetical protein